MNVPFALLGVTLFLLGAQLLGWFAVNSTVLGVLMVITGILVFIEALGFTHLTVTLPARRTQPPVVQ
jgi:uncharacterized membrane protein HdeD (DUF308 family)